MLAFWSMASAAQLALQLDTSEIAAGQTVGLTLQIIDGRARAVPKIAAPPGLVVEFVTQSSQAMMINFQTTETQTFRYDVRATAAGEYTLGPVTVVTTGGELTSPPARLHVAERTSSAGMDELVADLPDGLAYVGEVLVYHLKYQTTRQLVSARWGPPDNALLMAEPGVDPITADYVVGEGGKAVKVQELWYPYHCKAEGKTTLSGGSLLAQFAVKRRRGRSDPFFNDLPGFADVQNDSALSNPVPLEVRELPTEGRPVDFSGLVGSFVFSAAPSVPAVNVGETVTIDVSLSGSGAISGFKLPDWSGEGFRVYDDEPVATSRLSDGKFSSSATFKRAIVPQRPGPLTLPPLRASWFDPAEGRYVEQELPAITLDVSGTEAKAAVEGGAGAGTTGPGVDPTADDILPVRTQARIAAPWSGAWAWLLAVPGAGLLLAELAPRLRRRGAAPLERSFGFADLPDDPEGRLSGLERIFREEAGRRLSRPAPELKREDVASLGEEAAAIYAELDLARYRGGANLPEARVRAWVERR
ncbi:hypothetical protein LBMAG42_13190 [Deltaproteobacteria bacterium]|nr:hypothetical protein LBMAG42_13190 [Deltaproteobacteria bacterium]